MPDHATAAAGILSTTAPAPAVRRPASRQGISDSGGLGDQLIITPANDNWPGLIACRAQESTKALPVRAHKVQSGASISLGKPCTLRCMDSIAALVLSLQKSGLDMFEQRRHREEIARRGADAMRELLPLISSDPPLVEGLLLETLRRLTDDSSRTMIRYELEHRIAPNNEPSTRRVSIRVLVELYPDATHVGHILLDFAADGSRETKDMRLHALKAAARLQAAPVLGARLVDLLRDQDPDVVLEAMGALASYSGIISSEVATQELERLVGPTSPLEVRCRAIELLGCFAELDALERIMLLPLRREREYMAVQMMVRSLLEKPRSVVRLSPKSFEHLARRLLESMDYMNVTVQKKESWDQGVDVIAWREEDRLKSPSTNPPKAVFGTREAFPRG
jgi:hypothetical protein